MNFLDERKRERRRRKSTVQRKRQRLTNTSRKDRVFCQFNRLGTPLGSGDSTFFSVGGILKILQSDWVRERQNGPISA